jgi:hypothetical protein
MTGPSPPAHPAAALKSSASAEVASLAAQSVSIEAPLPAYFAVGEEEAEDMDVSAAPITHGTMEDYGQMLPGQEEPPRDDADGD